TEAVVVAVAVVPARDEPDGQRRLERDPSPLEVPDQAVPGVGGDAELERLGDLGAGGARLEAGLAGAAPTAELAGPGGRHGVHVEEPAALAAPRLLLGRHGPLRDGDADALAELTGHLPEALALELHEEREDVPVLVASEAVVRAPRRADMERGRFFL